MRQAEPDVRSYAVTHPAGPLVPPQAPGWHQLIYASTGVLTAWTEAGTWTVPRHRALWVPAGIKHRLEVVHRTSLRTLYLADHLGALPTGTRVLDLPPLLRELVLHLVAVAPLTVAEPAHARLIAVLRDLLTESRVDGALVLPLPVDRAALEATKRMELPVPLLCNEIGISRRTLERRFLDETGMTFGQWRRRARMLAAVRELAAGATVAAAAQGSGYATPSAFSAAFRAELGTSPSKWSA
ncbi:AraC family transcriptional regulator [Labedaea rhizosphaerae]|nr:helix-turn-helix transcriptional regulator [Labedaea rhizosphaerae]